MSTTTQETTAPHTISLTGSSKLGHIFALATTLALDVAYSDSSPRMKRKAKELLNLLEEREDNGWFYTALHRSAK